MSLRKSFIAEINQEKRENNSEQKMNIIFLEIVYVLYKGSMSLFDNPHQARNAKERESIKLLPFFTSKLSPTQLNSYSVDDLSALLDFNRDAIQNLITLCEKNNAKIVISSRWGSEKNLQQIKDLFSVYGFGKYIIDCVSSVDANQNDIQQIEKWLNDHREQVNSYVILGGRNVGLKLSNYFGERYIYNNFFVGDSVEKAGKVLSHAVEIKKSISFQN